MSTERDALINAIVSSIPAPPIYGNHGGGMPMPMIIESTHKGDRGFDPFSRLLRDRIVYLGTAIDGSVANVINAVLLYLDNEGDAPIIMYLNSPGGVVSAGLAIYDTMNHINAPVHTLCAGSAASMGAVLLAAGAKGHRYVLPNSQVMIHQPLSGARGQVSDIEIQAAQARHAKEVITDILTECTGQPREVIVRDIDRDFYLHGPQVVEYGLADKLFGKREKRTPKKRGWHGETDEAKDDGQEKA